MLQDKVVVITGANGGLGSALVKRFLNEGCKVAAIARSQASLDAMSAELTNDNLSTYVADVSDNAQVSQAFSDIITTLNRIDILFNNAAVYPRLNFLDETPEQWQAAIDTNISGIAYCCKAALPSMIKNGYGRVFNLGSFADISPIPDAAAYSCSKGAVHGLTKAIAADIAAKGGDIEIHEWIPGHMKTAMSDFTGNDPEISAGWAVEILTGQVEYASKNTLFENNREFLPPQSLKQRLKNKLMFWKS